MANPWDNDPIVNAAPTGGMIYRDPFKDQEQAREAERMRMAQEAAERARRNQDAAEEDRRRKGLEWNATHNPDGSLKTPAKPRTFKPLPDGAAKRYEDAINSFAALDRAIGTFEDDFAGNTLTGGAENTIQGRFSGFGTEGQNQWWADVAATDNSLRNALFGASLTTGEKSAYERTTVTPSMDPQLVKENLLRRRELAMGVLQRRTNFLKANGYDPAAVEALSGEYAPDLARKPSKQGQGKKNDEVAGIIGAAGQSGGNGPGRLAGGSDTRKSIPIPPDMQAEYAQFVGNGGPINPQEYASFRVGLDEKYGFGRGDTAAYAREAEGLNKTRASDREFIPTIPAADAEMTGRDKLNASVFNSTPGAFLMGVGSLGGGMDEVVGGISSLATGRDFSTEVARMDAMRQASASEYPGATMAGNLAGSIAAGYGVSRLGGAVAGLPGQLGLGAATGAAQGALESNSDRFSGAMVGAGLGAGGTLAGRYIAAPALESASRSRPFRKAMEALNGMTGGNRTLAPVPQFTPQQRVIAGVGQDSLATARNNLNDAARLNAPYALADADPRLRTLAGTVSRKSVDARALAENTFEPRALGQGDRAVEAIDTYLAPVADIRARSGDLMQAARTASAPYYNMASQRAGVIDDEVAAILNTDAGKDALSRAYRIASNDGRDPNKMGFDLNDQGEVILRDAPSFETLDLVKRGLDDKLGEYRNPMTGKLDLEGNPLARSVEGLRQRFVGRMDALNDQYPKARAEYAQYAQQRDALDRGYRAPSTTLRPRDLPAITGSMKPEQLAEFQRGYATKLADDVDATKLVSDPFKRIYGSTADQQKIDTLFPQSQDFRRIAELERDMSKTAYETTGGSPTASRLAADNQLTGNLGTMAVDAGTQMMTGGGAPLGSMWKAAQAALSGSAKLGIGKAAERRATELAPVLFDTSNPAASAAMLDEITQTAIKLAQRKREAGRYGALYGGLAAPAIAPSW